MRATIFPAILAVALFSAIFSRAAEPKFVGETRMVLQQVAAEPDIVTPTGVAVDAQRRIWVIENRTHQRPANYTGPKTMVGPELSRLGLIVSENFDGTVSIAGVDGKIERIRKLDIEEKKASAKSPMPDGLEKLLTLREFRDLPAYRESLK